MARPRLPEDKKRSKYIRVRVTKSERATVLRRAKAAGSKDEAEWIRARLLGE